MKTKTYCLALLIGFSLMFAAYEAALYWHNLIAPESLVLWGQLLFVVLLVMWVDADSKDQPNVYRPYEYGFLVFLFWVPYLPYYLWRTRGPSGLLVLCGLLSLFFLGYIAQWVIYLVR